jgi:citrate/tricarballylate utilization protein
VQTTEAIEDARRAMHICNACRYCEGFCAVFPAMELRRTFTNADLAYLANLCHNCSGCYYSCQYAPPHEFALNLPQTFAQVRNESYVFYAWPKPLAILFERNGVVVGIVAAVSVALVMVLTSTWRAPHILYARHTGPGSFYQIIPLLTMTALAILTFGFSLLAMTMGFLHFWRDTGGKPEEHVTPQPLFRATSDILTLKNLGGAGGGCNDQNEAYSTMRRNYHHFLFYGFSLCTASTIVAGIYEHFLHWMAPYPFFSIPVLLGTVGGIGMTIGCTGLLVLKVSRDQIPTARNLLGADVALTLLLGMSALSGLLLLALRSTSAMGIFLALHLGFIFALFLVLPYSKFVHGVYRSAALLRNAIERKTKASITEDQM